MNRVEDLRERHAAGQLTAAEVLELFDYFKTEPVSRNWYYNYLINAMYVFVPYLQSYPQLIRPFVEAVYLGGNQIIAGVSSKAGFFEFLASKSQVDDQLKAALNAHYPEFEAAYDNLPLKLGD